MHLRRGQIKLLAGQEYGKIGMKGTSRKNNPVAVLVGISPEEILEKYESGYYFREYTGITEEDKIRLEGMQEDVTMGNDMASKLYRKKVSNRPSEVCCIREHKLFLAYKGGETLEGGRCDHCKTTIDGRAVGYATKYERRVVEKEGKLHVLHIFWTEGIFCNNSCSLGFVRRFVGCRELPIEKAHQIEIYTRLLDDIMRKNAGDSGEDYELKPAEHPGLLEENFGPLTREQWTRPGMTFVPSTNLHLVPSITEYIRKAQ